MKNVIRKWIFEPASPFRLALLLSLPLILVLALLIYNLIDWEKKSLEEIQITNTKELARAFFNHIVSTNIWSEQHGGIYIEMIQHAPGQENRRPLSIMGKDFVKISPNMITQQIARLIEKRSAYTFHVTSLKPSSPEGMPDQWETAALLDFEQGAVEASTVTQINNKRYFRYMAPLTIDKTCLSCHQMKGYQLSDIRGGLSIDIPLESTDRLFAVEVKRSALSFATFGIFTMISIILITWFFSKRISDAFKEKIKQQELLKNLNDQLNFLYQRDRKILGSIVDGIAIINDQGMIESANDAFLRYTDSDINALKGKHIEDLRSDPVMGSIFSPSPVSAIEIKGRVFTLTEVTVASEDDNKLLCSLRIIHDATD
ncbi:MAG: DUF3365 domain-containing protein, partial [Nitrospirota bacterium]